MARIGLQRHRKQWINMPFVQTFKHLGVYETTSSHGVEFHSEFGGRRLLQNVTWRHTTEECVVSVYVVCTAQKIRYHLNT